MDIKTYPIDIKTCPICSETEPESSIHLCGGVFTLIHGCVNDIEIKIQADTRYGVIKKWNTFVNYLER